MKILSVKMINEANLPELRETSEYKDAKRQLREPLLKAFDVYKTNVYYGVEKESEHEKAEIIEWYEALCNLQEDALKNVPSKISRYI
jgi:hypothetical protein